MESREKVGSSIRARRLARGWTQEQLAENLHCSPSAIAMYESGKRYPKPDVVEALAEVFNIPIWAVSMTDEEMQDFNSLRTEFQSYEEEKLNKLLANSPRLPSNVRPISDLHRQRIPMIGAVAAGEPIYDPEEQGVYVTSPVDADAAITIHGDSMEPTYLDGDVVYIKCRPDVPEGAVAVVFLDDEATIKHVYKRPTGLTLWSDNPNHLPMQIEFEDYANVRIFGVPGGYTRIYKQGISGKIRKGL